MPYVIEEGSIAEIRIKGRLFEQNIMMVLHYSNTDEYADGKAALLAFLNGPFQDAGAPFDKIQQAMSEEVTDLYIEGQWIWPTRYAYVAVEAAVTTGGIAEESLPPNVAATITKRTDRAGRDQVGSLHMPGVPKAGQDGGEFEAVYFTRLEDIAGALIAELGVGDLMLPIIYHRDSPDLSPYISGAQAQTTIRVERRRTVGLGT